MNKNLLQQAAAVVTSLGILIPANAPAHTVSFGFANAGPGAVTVWAGSYHTPGELPTNEGSLLLTPQFGAMTPISTPFNLASGTKPAGLIDGTTNFFTDGGAPPMLIGTDPGLAGAILSWQGATVGGLVPGPFTIAYDPAFVIPSLKWTPWDAAIQGGTVLTITAAVLAGTPAPAAPPAAPVFVNFILIDAQATISLAGSALPMALSQRELALSGVSTALRDVNGRLFRLRAGLPTQGGVEIGLYPEETETLSYGKDGKQVAVKQLPPERPGFKFRVYASGDYSNTDRERIDRSPGFQQDVYAGTLGLEMDVAKSLTLGVGATYLDSDGDIGQGVGKADLEGFAISPYLSWHSRDFYADVLYSYGQFDHDLRRDTLFGPTATADPESSNHSAQLNLGYHLRVGGLVTGPFASLDYTRGELDGYTEEGAGRFNARVGTQSYDSLRSRLGWQASFSARTAIGTVTPQLRASWVREYANEDEAVSASLVESPFRLVTASGSRSIGGLSSTRDTRRPGQDALALGGGINFDLGTCFSLLLDYEAMLAQDDNVQQFASVRASINF